MYCTVPHLLNYATLRQRNRHRYGTEVSRVEIISATYLRPANKTPFWQRCLTYGYFPSLFAGCRFFGTKCSPEPGAKVIQFTISLWFVSLHFLAMEDFPSKRTFIGAILSGATSTGIIISLPSFVIKLTFLHCLNPSDWAVFSLVHTPVLRTCPIDFVQGDRG